MDYAKKCRSFIEYLEKQSYELLEDIDSGKDYSEQYDIVITCNEQLIRVPMNADSFSRLVTFMEDEIEEDTGIRPHSQVDLIDQLLQEHKDTADRLQFCRQHLLMGKTLNDDDQRFVEATCGYGKGAC